MTAFADAVCSTSAVTETPSSRPAAVVYAALAVPDEQPDYGRAKISFYRLVDSLIDSVTVKKRSRSPS